MGRETLFSIQTEEQIDNLEKPRISFYSPRKRIQKLLALPEVKKDLRSYVKDGKRVDVSKINNDFIGIDFYNKDGSWDNCWTHERRPSHPSGGMGILQQGLDNIGKTARIIREDIRNVKDNPAYQLGRGVVYGLATPFDINGGVKHAKDTMLDDAADVASQSQVSYIIPTIIGAVPDLPIELKLAYFGTAAATNVGINVGRYLKGVRKISKEQK